MLFVVRSTDELRALRRRAARRSVTRVALELIVEPEVRASLERRINRWLASCGCVTGAVFVAVGMISMLGVAGTMPMPPGTATIRYALAVLLALGLAGKLAGLLGARMRLESAIRAALRAAS